MKKNFRFLFFALALLPFSCSIDEIDTAEELQDAVTTEYAEMSFRAVMESPEVKTALGDNNKTVSWIAGDRVKFIWELDKAPSSAISSALTAGDIADGAATFTAEVPDAFNQTEDDYKAGGGTSLHLYAVYPSGIDHDYSNASTLYVTVPTAQDGSFAGANIMLAKWNKSKPNDPLVFQNLCGILKIVVTDASVRKIVLSGDDDITGKMCVTFNPAPVVKSITEGTKSVTLSVPGAGTYYAAVIPSDISNIYVGVYDNKDNLLGDKISSNTLKIGRRELCSLGTIGTDVSDRYFVKADGSGDGSSWDNAAPYSSLSTVFAANTTKKVYMAAGTYSVTEQIAPGTSTTSANVSIFGGFPADATGVSLAGRDIANNATILDAGGACRIWIFQRGTWVIDGITFKNAYRKNSDTGSALIFEGNASCSFTVKNCTFTGNKNEAVIKSADGTDYTKYGGGAIRISGCPVTMQNCKFFANTSDANGGAIFVSSTGTLNATGCTFGEEDNAEKANTATVSGRSIGACVYVLGAANITNCGFYSNSTIYRGGAVGMKNGGKVKISGCTFRKNTAKIGGALFVAAITDGVASLDVDNTMFSANTADGNGGGAVGVSGDSKTYTGLLNFSKCKFDANTTTGTNGGAAVWNNGAGASFTDCSFTSNKLLAAAASENATGGGAIYCGMSTANRLFFNRCFFANNGMFSGSSTFANRWGHHLCVASEAALLGINNCVIRAPWGITITGDNTFKGRGSAITSRCKTVIVNTTVFCRVGNPMITQGNTDENGFSFVNSIAINSASTPNCFYNYDTAKYLNLYYSLYTQFKDGTNNTTTSNCVDGVAYGDMGWAQADNGSAMTVDDVRTNFYYYPWSGTIEGKTVVKPTFKQVKDIITGTTDVGTAFLSWLGEDNLKIDIRGEARDTDAMWPGSYQGASAPASAQAFNLK